MNINNAAIRENIFKTVFRQRVITRSATHDYGFNIQIIQGVCHAMKQYAVFGNHIVGFVFVAARVLWIAAAQITWRQHRLHTSMIQHRLRG